MKSKYVLPQNIYKETVYFIKQYPEKIEMLDYLRKRYDVSSATLTNFSKNSTQDNQDRIGTYIVQYMDTINKIEEDLQVIIRAREKIPLYYRDGVIEHIIYSQSYNSKKANTKTWEKYSRLFIYQVAKMRYGKNFMKVVLENA